MWTVYKREIMQREKEQKDFLKKYYAHNKQQHEMQLQNGNGPIGKQGRGHVMPPRQESEDDWPVELDSDEEPVSFQVQKNKEVSSVTLQMVPVFVTFFLTFQRNVPRCSEVGGLRGGGSRLRPRRVCRSRP